MTTTIACIIIATERRYAQVKSRVVPSALRQGFDHVLVVGDWEGEEDFDYLCVAPLTRTTTDALVKRDVGTLATDADVLVYLCDDHILTPGFGAALRAVLDEPWDVIVPNRYTLKATQHHDSHWVETVSLNNGERDGYCGGHCGIFRRDVITAKPWLAHAHHRNWDALISAEQIARGARFVWGPRAELSIIDLEPEARPWE